jgi:hypothetical protein
MTKLIEQAAKQLVDVASRENDDTLAMLRQQIAERSQHVDFLEQWFSYSEQQIETIRRAAIEEANASINRGFQQMTDQLNHMKDAVLPGAVKAVSDLTEAMNRFKE